MCNNIKKKKRIVVDYHGTYRGAKGIAVLTGVTGLDDRFVMISKKGVLENVRRESFTLSLDTAVRHTIITSLGYTMQFGDISVEDALQYAVRDANAVAWHKGMPLMTRTCWRCEREVDLDTSEFLYDISRINGNSKYGYEPCHSFSCYKSRFIDG